MLQAASAELSHSKEPREAPASPKDPYEGIAPQMLKTLKDVTVGLSKKSGTIEAMIKATVALRSQHDAFHTDTEMENALHAAATKAGVNLSVEEGLDLLDALKKARLVELYQ